VRLADFLLGLGMTLTSASRVRPLGLGAGPAERRAPPLVFSCELLGGVCLGFLVVSPIQIAGEFLQPLGAEAKARPG
jgi:hypothetical protein